MHVKTQSTGATAAAQWVKNLTAAVWVTAEMQVLSSAWSSGLKDLALLKLQLEFNPWPGNFHVPRVWKEKKITKHRKHIAQNRMRTQKDYYH